MAFPLRIVHLEDNHTDSVLVQEMLEAAGLAFEISLAQSGEEFGEALLQGEHHLILADYRLPAYDGMSALRLARRLRPDTPFIFVSGTMGEEAVIEALTEGATDYVLKQNLSRLAPAVRRALKEAEDRRERRWAEETLHHTERKTSILNRILGVFLSAPDENLYGEVLAVILDATKSRFGLFGFIADNGDLVFPSLSREVWSQCAVSDKAVVFPPGMWGKSCWGRSIAEQKTFCSEGPFSIPEGHIRIDNFLTTPIVHAVRTIGLIAVANKEGGYTGEDRELFECIANNVSPILNARLQKDREERRRMEAEKELHESLSRERVLGDIIRSASVGIKIIKPDGAIVPLNDAMINITGYTAEELKTADWSNLITPGEFRVHEQACLTELRSTGKPVTYEKEYVRKDGSRIQVQLVVHGIFDACASLLEYVAFVTDISSRKAAEDERRNLELRMRQTQKMEAIGTLAGGIAHDFNNILSAIVGYSEMALAESEACGRLRTYVEQVLKAAARATDLVKQILTFSRQSEEALRPVPIAPIIKEAVKFLRASIPATIDIRLELTADPQRRVMGDPTQIHQVVMNLCTNAAYAMRERGGALEVALGEVDIGQQDLASYLQLAPGRYLRLKVGDTGGGMDEETLQRIFDPFFTTKPRDEGTGMGLAVVRGIVESCGGGVSVRSKPGVGTDFHVYFPQIVSSAAEKASEAGDAPTGKGTILFVDDEEPVTHLGKISLERLGYSVVAITESIEALEVFRSEPDRFDLVITDLTMPRMNGIELSRRLWKIRKEIPIILCTGYSEFLDEKDALELGFQEFVRKPILRHVMARAIQRSLQKKELPPEATARHGS